MVRTFDTFAAWKAAALDAGLSIEVQHDDYPKPSDLEAPVIAFEVESVCFEPTYERGSFDVVAGVGVLADTADEYIVWANTEGK